MARVGTPASAARRRPVPGGPQPATVHQLKATLSGVRPPIWRRLEVHSSSTLGKLHAMLQIAFAWDNSHLHDFGSAHGDAGGRTSRTVGPSRAARRTRTARRSAR